MHASNRDFCPEGGLNETNGKSLEKNRLKINQKTHLNKNGNLKLYLLFLIY